MTSRRFSPDSFDRARAFKVSTIVAGIPSGTTTEEIARIAAELERLTPRARNKLARAIGSRPPSDETWRMVVEACRLRVVDPFADETPMESTERVAEESPYVCPGCHAVAEPCAPGCIDAEIERDRLHDDEEREDFE